MSAQLGFGDADRARADAAEREAADLRGQLVAATPIGEPCACAHAAGFHPYGKACRPPLGATCACRGYVSLTLTWAAAMRAAGATL